MKAETIIEDLKTADATLDADGYHVWSLVRTAILSAIEELTAQQAPEPVYQLWDGGKWKTIDKDWYGRSKPEYRRMVNEAPEPVEEETFKVTLPEPLHDSDTWRFPPKLLQELVDINDTLNEEESFSMEQAESVLLATYVYTNNTNQAE